MANCPICGVANQEGNRFCSSCGAALPTRTGIRCPMCGEMNPLGNVFCDHCSARLVPLTAGPPPEESLEEEPEEPSPVKAFSLPTISLGDKEPEADQEDDWLASLRTEADQGAETPAAESEVEEFGLPDWLAGDQDEEPAAPAPAEPAEETPDWLAGIGEQAQDEEAETEEFGLPDWLTGAQDEEPAAPTPAEPAEEAPEWQAGIGEQAPYEEGEAEEFGLPDWLAGDQDEEPAAPAPAEPAEEAPAWLAEIGEEAPPGEAEAEEFGLPDWLAGAQDEEPAAPAPTEPAEEVPDWLAGIETEEPSAPTVPAFAEPAEETPDWLAGIAEEAPPETGREEPGLPDWLAGIQDEEPAAPTPAEPDEEMPDWLAGIETEEPSAPAVPAFAGPAEEIPDDTALSGLPDWLEEAPDAPAEEPSSVPAFDLPGDEAVDWQAAEEPSEAEASPLSGLPSWLVADDTAAPSEQEPTEPLFTTEEATEVPDWLAAAGPPPPAAGDEASLDWLDDLAEVEGTAAAAPLPSALAAGPPPPEAEGLVRGEIPPWLEALRPKTEAETAAEEPPETTGLLEGIRGTLVPNHIVDMPQDAKQMMPSAPSAAAIARAELLQELLGRPASPPLEITEERGRRITLPLQIGVALALLAAIVIPMFLPIPLFGAPSTSAGESLYNTIEQQIAPDSSVLVAFEYGPADADEMDWVALSILRHLLQRGERLIIVSTQPEGAATAERLLKRLLPEATAREAYAANLGYQPGQVAGIQGLLADLQNRVEVRSGMAAAETAAMEGISNAGDTEAVLILAAQADDLRYWIEQTSASYPDVALLAGLSARAETTSLPYLAPEAEQLEGAVVGIIGAAAYERTLGGEEQGNFDRFYLPSLGAAQLVVLAILIAGMLIYILQPGGRKR